MPFCMASNFLLTSRKTSFIFLIEEQACTLTLAGSARWTISGMASRSGGTQLKIIQLSAENVKRLIAVEIKPDGNLVQITGKNGQGKTSVLDSIWWALSVRVIRVRDGSLLDEESLALLAKMADERDYQVWIERVEPGKVGFVIEDGQVRQEVEHVG